MPIASFRYTFRQDLNAPARAAFEWCTDFGPDDGPLFSGRTIRTVRRLSEDAVVMTDLTFPGGRRRRIRRLVRIDPDRLSWTNTHLDGPFRHSQFWYRIVPDGRTRCHLDFEGLRLETVPRAPGATAVARHSKELRTEDSTEWRQRLAPALEADLRGRR